LKTIKFDVGGDDELVDEDEGDRDVNGLIVVEPSFGAIAIGGASTLLCAGYPSHSLPDLRHFWH
jgi:hypothetical protein